MARGARVAGRDGRRGRAGATGGRRRGGPRRRPRALRAALADREGRFAEAAAPDAIPVAGEAALSGRVPFLAALFAGARFVYVAGEADGPGWAQVTERLLDDLEALAPEQWCVVEDGALLAAPRAELQRLCGFLGLRYDQALLTPVEEARAARRVRDLVAADAPGPPPPPGDPFRSVSTASVAGQLHELGGSLLISTYQSHRLVIARADDGRRVRPGHRRGRQRPGRRARAATTGWAAGRATTGCAAAAGTTGCRAAPGRTGWTAAPATTS